MNFITLTINSIVKKMFYSKFV